MIPERQECVDPAPGKQPAWRHPPANQSALTSPGGLNTYQLHASERFGQCGKLLQPHGTGAALAGVRRSAPPGARPRLRQVEEKKVAAALRGAARAAVGAWEQGELGSTHTVPMCFGTGACKPHLES